MLRVVVLMRGKMEPTRKTGHRAAHRIHARQLDRSARLHRSRVARRYRSVADGAVKTEQDRRRINKH